MMRTDWLLLGNAMLGTFLSGLVGRIFMISLPSVAAGLGTDILGVSWAVISFQLASMSLALIFGRLGDIYGRSGIYGLGVLLITASTILCGMAPDIFQLTVYRFLQGVGAAMINSVGRVLAMEAAPEGSEGRAQGLMTMAHHFGFFVGPPLGGAVIDYFGWRWSFFFLVPFGLAGVALSVLGLQRGRERPARQGQPSVDYLGAALFILSMVILTLILDRRIARLVGLGQGWVLAVAFGGTLAGFLVQEQRAVGPMMNLSLFRIHMFTFSSLSLLIVTTTQGLLGFLLPFYLQEVLHLSPSSIGLIFLAAPIFSISLATLSGAISDRIGPRVPATIGVLIGTSAFLIGATLGVDSHWILPTAMMALVGLGSAFFNTPNQTAIMTSVPREHRGLATGMINTIFGLGNMLGISLTGMLLALAFQHYSGSPGATPSAENPLAFVASINVTCLVALGLGLVAVCTSFMRGRPAPRSMRATSESTPA